MFAISTMGTLAVLASLAAAAFGVFAGLALVSGQPGALAWAKRCGIAFGVGMIIANGLMEWALITHDFSVGYVAEVGSRSTPLSFTIVSLWSSLDGSILFWGLILGLYVLAFVKSVGSTYRPQLGFTFTALFAVCVFFAWLIAGLASPFDLVSPVPADGPGPNPLLQNHVLMIIHPPMLYGGYVGMSLPFAMTVGALASGALDAEWMRRIRFALLVPWLFLTAGILLGGWWSYEVLGWGGYWAWDPVENASFLPWLTATAALHSSMVTERKGALRAWTLSLILASFLLTILGTFMTRSGVFNSVHSFTQSPIGPVFLVFLGIGMLVSVVLVAWRIDDLGPDQSLGGALSRDAAFLANNLLFLAFTFTVLLGTIYPLLNEALTEARVSVGEPYFNKMAVPLGLGLIALMGWGATVPWRPADPSVLKSKLSIACGSGLAVGIIAWAIRGFEGGVLYPSTLAAAGFSTHLTIAELFRPGMERAKRSGQGFGDVFVGILKARRRTGAYVVHIGILLIAVGIATSSTYRQERGMTMSVNESGEFAGYRVVFDGFERDVEPHRTGRVAHLSAFHGDEALGAMSPRLNHYPTRREPIGTPAVYTTLAEDLYISLVQIDEAGGEVSIRVIVEPLVSWIWLGGGVLVFGGLLILSERKTRRRRKEDAA